MAQKPNTTSTAAPPKVNGALAPFLKSARTFGEDEGNGMQAFPNLYSVAAEGAAAGAIKDRVVDLPPLYDIYQDGKKAVLKAAYVPPENRQNQIDKLAMPMEAVLKFDDPKKGLAAWQTGFRYFVGTSDGKEKGAGGRVLRNLQDFASAMRKSGKALTKDEMAEIVSSNKGDGTKKNFRGTVESIATRLENIADKKKGTPAETWNITAEHKSALDKARRILEDLAKVLPEAKKKPAK